MSRGRSAFNTSLLALAVVLPGCIPPQGPASDPEFDVKTHYQKTEHRIPMRDGVRLHTIVYTPRDTSRSYPILLQRTPYSVAPYGERDYRRRLGPSVEFDRQGYVFVFQDVRGKFKSEGEFEVIRPYLPEKSGPQDVDESSDTYDTIEWLLANLPHHNGRVGQWGVSYPGWETVLGMIDAHPALVASSPQASPSDMFIGDDWHHNGAFRLMYAFAWLSSHARRRDAPSSRRAQRFDYGTPSGYEFFLTTGTISRINDLYFRDQVPAWNEFMEHGTYDEYWRRQVILPHLKDIRHPVLNVAGWFDAEDFYGPMSIYAAIERENRDNSSTLVVGPWLHGGWISMEGASLGCIDFSSPTSKYFQREILHPFFRHFLKDRGPWNLAEAVVFETGRNAWRSYERWPPRQAVPTELYLEAGGRLSFTAPAQAASEPAVDRYVSDPARPVPFSAEVRTTQGHLWMIEDQRFVATRPDVLVYQSDVLRQDLTIAGPIGARLFVSTTGSDSDWIVKLIDVYPPDAPESDHCGAPMGGFQMLLAGEIMRGKFRRSFTHPEAMVPGEVTQIDFDLPDRYHTFRRGHRIMVQIQSTWFPVYDRNPQRFVDIYHAEPEDFQPATQSVYRSAPHPSHLVLGVMP